MLEKVADSARKAVKLAEPYKPYGGQFLEFCSISSPTYQTCMKLTRKSTEFCQFYCRHYPQMPSAKAVKEQYEIVVATSAMIVRKEFAPHTGARSIPPT